MPADDALIQTPDQPSQDGVPAWEVFDTVGAARYIGCTPGHLKNLRATGDGPIFTRLFRRKGIQYSRADIDLWKRAKRYGSTTEYPEALA